MLSVHSPPPPRLCTGLARSCDHKCGSCNGKRGARELTNRYTLSQYERDFLTADVIAEALLLLPIL